MNLGGFHTYRRNHLVLDVQFSVCQSRDSLEPLCDRSNFNHGVQLFVLA